MHKKHLGVNEATFTKRAFDCNIRGFLVFVSAVSFVVKEHQKSFSRMYAVWRSTAHAKQEIDASYANAERKVSMETKLQRFCLSMLLYWLEENVLLGYRL